ncbi:MAG: proprotein convertase P-domain-containing protein, partial [Saprospiraceae bacterium]|nr:proprotein convertase P-domain-containing protein [Saprospiraceae bacterium]
GHVFGTGGGGVASLGVVCGNSVKARGVTGTSQPVGDPFDVDYVSHEMGHQFGANHCFNNSCGGNINPATAFEPGSGTTIMAYAGVCSPNVQNNSDAYFHAISLQEIGAYVSAGQGGVCPVQVNTGNDAPVVAPVGNFTIPKSTPFALTAVATDPDGDALSYCWEQMDNTQAAAPPVSTSTAGPLFRSFSPSPSPTRYFPRLADLVANVNPTWEELPGVARSMNFRVSVRDNHPGGGCTHEANVQLNVAGSAGPFVVTTPNTSLNWFVGNTETVVWDVAGTDAAPVSCAQVRLLLSTDGGLTYPTVLAASVPNNGSAQVTVPNLLSPSCRVMVQAVGNVFFDISNQNFTIALPPVPTFLLAISAAAEEQRCTGDTLRFTADLSPIAGFDDPVELDITGAPANATVSIDPNPAPVGGSANLEISGLGTPGNYTLTLTATSGAIERTADIQLTVVDGAPAAPVLTSPADGALSQSQAPELTWAAVPNALGYQVQVATSPAFYPGELIFDQNVTTPNATVAGLGTATVYYWRVNVENACGESPYAPARAFQTGKLDCGYNFASADVPVAISSADIVTVTSELNLPTDRAVADLDLRVQVQHSWVGDLVARLIGPAGTAVALFDQPGFPATGSGCNGDSLSLHFNDAATATAVQLENTCGNLPAIAGSFQPLEMLSVFNNRSAQGAWTLEMTDNFPEDGGAITAWSLELCFFDTVPAASLLTNSPLTVAAGSAGVITDSYLELSVASNVPDEGIFTLLRLPQHGELRLNGLPLGVGDRFTQANILTGSLEYRHNGNTATTDDFLFDAVDMSNNGWVHAATFHLLVLQNDLEISAAVTLALRCHNDSTAQITATVTGGTAPYFFSLNGGASQGSNVFDGLPAGDYSVEVTDAFGFTVSSNNISVTNPAQVLASASVTDDDITASASGGTPPYEYSLDGQVFQPETLFENLPNGDYTVTVRDAKGCTATALATVEVGVLKIQLGVQNALLCHGDTDGALSANATGGVLPYAFSRDGQNFQPENTFTGLGAGAYTVIVRDDSGNTATSNAVTLADPPALQVSANAALNVISVAASGGTGALSYSLDGQNFQPEASFGGLPNGDYTVTVRDANGCTATATATVDVPALTIAGILISEIFCAGEPAEITVSASGGIPPYEFRLDDGPYQTDSVLQLVGAGVHTVSVRDADGTVVTTPNFIVAQPAPLALNTFVSGNDLLAQGQGGVPPYQYSLNGSPFQPSGDYIDLANGQYTIVVLDANGCTATDTIEINIPPLVVTSVVTNPPCFGGTGSINLLISGGTPPYSCSTPGGNTCLFDNLPVGVWSFIISDAAGSTATVSATISSPLAIAAGAAVSSDTITVLASGGTGVLEYSLDGQAFQSDPVFAGVPNGTYTLVVRDANGCTATIPNVVVDYTGTVSPQAVWGLRVLPNPSTGRFRLLFGQAPAGRLQMDVFDATGRMVREQNTEGAGGESSFELDLTGFPAGVYTLRMTSGAQVGAVRLVVR